MKPMESLKIYLASFIIQKMQSQFNTISSKQPAINFVKHSRSLNNEQHLASELNHTLTELKSKLNFHLPLYLEAVGAVGWVLSRPDIYEFGPIPNIIYVSVSRFL